MSHAKLGWNLFTDTVISKVSSLKKNVVFILWGKFAQEKQGLIDETKHALLKSAHPSRFFSPIKDFSDAGIFPKQTNTLQRMGLTRLIGLCNREQLKRSMT